MDRQQVADELRVSGGRSGTAVLHMSLKMPGPVALAPSNVFHLNVRVPRDLVDKLRGSRVTLPIADKTVEAKVGDKVVVSLGTKDVRIAHARFAAAFARFQAHWEAVRRGPQPLTHKQIVALAGEAYRGMVGSGREDDLPDFEAHSLQHEAAIEAWAKGDPDAPAACR